MPEMRGRSVSNRSRWNAARGSGASISKVQHVDSYNDHRQSRLRYRVPKMPHWINADAALEELQRMYALAMGSQQTGGGRAYTVEDHIRQMQQMIRERTPLATWQADSGLPVEYVLALKDYVEQLTH